MDDNTKWTKVDRSQNDTTTKRAKLKKKNFHSFIIFTCGVG